MGDLKESEDLNKSLESKYKELKEQELASEIKLAA